MSSANDDEPFDYLTVQDILDLHDLVVEGDAETDRG